MKKIIIIVFLVLLSTGCGKKTFDIDIKDCKILEEQDSHSGFLGDGNYYAKLECENYKMDKDWKEMPLPKTLKEVLDIDVCGTKGCKNFYERYKVSKDVTKNGYYYFLDRSEDAKDRHDTKSFKERHSYNLTIVIYNPNNNIMYYYEMDT